MRREEIALANANTSLRGFAYLFLESPASGNLPKRQLRQRDAQGGCVNNSQRRVNLRTRIADVDTSIYLAFARPELRSGFGVVPVLVMRRAYD